MFLYAEFVSFFFDVENERKPLAKVEGMCVCTRVGTLDKRRLKEIPWAKEEQNNSLNLLEIRHKNAISEIYISH